MKPGLVRTGSAARAAENGSNRNSSEAAQGGGHITKISAQTCVQVSGRGTTFVATD